MGLHLSRRSLLDSSPSRTNPNNNRQCTMMRRWCAAAGLGRRLLSSSVSAPAHRPLPAHLIPSPRPLPFSSRHHLLTPPLGLHPSSPPPMQWQTQQVRHFAAKDRSRAPRTPTTSKVKKYKIKPPSVMNDGQVRRWRAGKRHNAHLKSKEAKRRLRKPALVHLAYAKVIKKLNFCS
uniref:50S ribosomal protein L35 n=1 Tax=Oryza meridionalis TaxID=40149 RepID=A0A0E0F108_9ORYZ